MGICDLNTVSTSVDKGQLWFVVILWIINVYNLINFIELFTTELNTKKATKAALLEKGERIKEFTLIVS